MTLWRVLVKWATELVRNSMRWFVLWKRLVIVTVV